MNQYNLKLFFIELAILYEKHRDHIWTNAPAQQSHFGTTQAYWIDHKPIYFTFKLPHFIPKFIPP
jgi:hypothetical protein